MSITKVAPPRARVFLPQSRGDRVRAFLWSIVWQTLFRWSPRSMNGWRKLLLRTFGATVGRGAWIAPSARIQFPWNLTIGEHVNIQHKVITNCMGAVRIGEGTLISQYAHLCAGTHDYERPEMPIVPKPITIGKDVWIAADAFVGPGVAIGDGALLAARSSAFRDLPTGQICRGEPARPVASRE